MDDVLRTALEGIGWLNVYRNYLPPGHVLRARANGVEHEALSPYPGSRDRVPSWAVNSHTGVWNDMHMGARLPCAKNFGGNIIQHVAYMNAELTPDGKMLCDFPAAERELRVFAGLAQKVSAEWLAACRMRVANDGARWQHLWQPYKKAWTPSVLARLNIGWDADTGRMVIPILDRKGNVVNCRVYRPGPGEGPKMRWLHAGGGPQNLPFPASMAWEKSGGTVWLVEGETDAITLLCVGIRAVSGTQGGQQPVPYLGPEGAEWTRQTNVVVCMDADPVGVKAAETAVAALQRYVASVRRVEVPSWPGAPMKRDVTNYVEWLMEQGKTRDEVKATLLKLATEAEPVGPDATYDSEPTLMSFEDAISPTNTATRVQFVARVVAVPGSRHVAPYNMNLSCRRDIRACERCQFYSGNGLVALTVDHRSQLSMALTTSSDEQCHKMLKKHFAVPDACNSCAFEATTAMDAQIVQLGPPLSSDDLSTLAAEDATARRIEAQLVTATGVQLEVGREYMFRGFVYPSHRNQRAVMQLDRADPIADMAHGAPMPEKDAERLRSVMAGYGGKVADRLRAIADDMMHGVTGIRGRPDMHIGMMACFFNAVTFSVGGEHVPRGWIDFFILGDTRCGKSAAFKALCNWFGTGVLVDCKMQSIPGLLGAVEQSNITGERFVVPGVVPLNDRRGPIGFDEFTGARYGRTSILEAMSSTRAEGRVTINKAAHATFNARVSSVWMANPGEGRMIVDLPGFGVERIKALVVQPEDVARFDLAQVVTQQDVPLTELMAPKALTQTAMAAYDAKLLVSWSRSRRHEDYEFTEDAVDTLVTAATRMAVKYHQSIPLVEGATIRHKVAKIAVALAAMTFSSPDGQRVTVTGEHVAVAYGLMIRMYDSPGMAYNMYSAKRAADSTLRDADAVQAALSKEFGAHMYESLYNLTRVDSFSVRTFAVLVSGSVMNVQGVMSYLSMTGCIEPAGREEFRMTKAFLTWVKNYLAANGKDNEIGMTEGTTEHG